MCSNKVLHYFRNPRPSTGRLVIKWCCKKNRFAGVLESNSTCTMSELTIQKTFIQMQNPIVLVWIKLLSWLLHHAIVNSRRKTIFSLKIPYSSLSSESAWNCDATNVGLHCWTLLLSVCCKWLAYSTILHNYVGIHYQYTGRLTTVHPCAVQ